MPRTLPGSGMVLGLAIAILAGGCFADEGNVFSLDVGDCFDHVDEGDDQISDVVVIDCDSPHHNEVYAAFDLPGSDFPGAEEVITAGLVGCERRFVEFVGAALGFNDLDATLLAPTEHGWNARADREVVCYLLNRTGRTLVGSMGGTGAL